MPALERVPVAGFAGDRWGTRHIGDTFHACGFLGGIQPIQPISLFAFSGEPVLVVHLLPKVPMKLGALTFQPFASFASSLGFPVVITKCPSFGTVEVAGCSTEYAVPDRPSGKIKKVVSGRFDRFVYFGFWKVAFALAVATDDVGVPFLQGQV